MHALELTYPKDSFPRGFVTKMIKSNHGKVAIHRHRRNTKAVLAVFERQPDAAKAGETLCGLLDAAALSGAATLSIYPADGIHLHILSKRDPEQANTKAIAALVQANGGTISARTENEDPFFGDNYQILIALFPSTGPPPKRAAQSCETTSI